MPKGRCEKVGIMAGPSTAIANEFLRRAMRDRRPLTQMQLQKLVYIAHGWNLAINLRPLTTDDPQAWDYGPVYPDLWEAVRGYGGQPVGRMIKNSDNFANFFADDADQEARAEITAQETDLIDRVYEIYGQYHAFKLSAMTHEPGTPWYQVFVDNQNPKGLIHNNIIGAHFIALGQQRQPAA